LIERDFPIVKPLHSFIPSLAVMLMAAGGGSAAQTVLIERSEIRFTAKPPGAAVEGRFRRWKANVDFRPKQPAKSKADIEIALASVDVANEKTEAELRRPVWFDTAKFPVARFTSHGMRHVGHDRYEVPGRLTIKGITRDVVVPIALTKDAAGNSVAEGEFAFNRLDFRLGEGPFAEPGAMAEQIGVRVRMVLPPVA
jgi:polyisoprenoid-binding protein YceI